MRMKPNKDVVGEEHTHTLNMGRGGDRKVLKKRRLASMTRSPIRNPTRPPNYCLRTLIIDPKVSKDEENKES